MKMPKPLHHKELCQRIQGAELPFKNTNEIKSKIQFVGQERALKALSFGAGIKKIGYNIYAMGPLEIGKRALVNLVLESYAKKRPIPPDWCYIYNFSAPEKPIALKLPAGLGHEFQSDMETLIDEIGESILAVFESDEYLIELKRINHYFDKKKKKASQDISTKISMFYKERHRREYILQLTLIRASIQPLINHIKTKYKKYPQVVDYLKDVQSSVLKNFIDFIKKDAETDLFTLNFENPLLTKYKVNLLVNNSHLKTAPIIYERTPNYANLICRVEHTSQHGALVTNFSLIRAGSLHKANGGFLIMEARKLNLYPEAWEALKNALYAREIIIEQFKHLENDAITPVSLEPMPIPLDTKIILLGDRNTYYDMCDDDTDFVDIFKVAVDFNDSIERSKKNISSYSKLIASIIQREKLHPFLSGAVAEVINYSSRLAEDNKKLSTYFRQLEALIIEADYWASQDHKKMVHANHVKKALNAMIFRVDRSRELYYENISRNFIIIKTSGKKIGQTNCLSVRQVGNFSYGHPTRVTARVRVGKGKLVDIQREIKLAGPMHAKAGIIIANYLASNFDQEHLFALSASLSFEQIYCWTEGDSATVGELCALLSALAEVPILQNLAITGSADQYGNVQAIGGINEKIEGFYDICQAQGLTNNQGVIIPSVNKQNLMLRDDIIDAVRDQKFHIYPIETVDEALSLLTGLPTGKRDNENQFPKNSLYYRIEQRLKKFSQVRKRIKLDKN
ncbi:MAG: Lon protease family protein [Gammaproteobacteria bacterium]